MSIADAADLPLAIEIHSASPHKVKLVESTMESQFVIRPSEHLIGGKAFGRDLFDIRLREHFGNELIASHIAKHKEPKTQGGRSLRRYRRR